MKTRSMPEQTMHVPELDDHPYTPLPSHAQQLIYFLPTFLPHIIFPLHPSLTHSRRLRKPDPLLASTGPSGSGTSS